MTAVQNGMIDVEVIGGRVTAASGIGVCWGGGVCLLYINVCVCAVLYFYLLEAGCVSGSCLKKAVRGLRCFRV